MLNILAWNIQHRNGDKLEKLVSKILEKNPDIIVLTEYRTCERKILNDNLIDAGFKYQLESTIPDNKTNGLYIASKYKLTKSIIDYAMPEPSCRWLDLKLEDFDLRVVGVHIPDYSKSKKNLSKKLFWQNLNNFAQKYIEDNVVIIGDFNTGLADDAEGMPFECSEYMIKLSELGWIDTWRFSNPTRKEYTWYHARSKNGFRVDYAYISPSLKNSIINVHHNHEDRIMKYSDHSSISVSLDINTNKNTKQNESEAFNIIFSSDKLKKQMAVNVYNLIKSNIPQQVLKSVKFRYLQRNYGSNIGANLWNNKIFEINNYNKKLESITLIYPINRLYKLETFLNRDIHMNYEFIFQCCLIELSPNEVLKFTDEFWNDVKYAISLAFDSPGKTHSSNIIANIKPIR